MATISQDDKIKEIAYQLWEEEGRPVGRDVEHYFKAQQILNGKPVKSASTTKATTRKTAKATTTARKAPVKKSA